MIDKDFLSFKEEKFAMREEAARIHEHIMKRLNKIDQCTERISGNIAKIKHEERVEKEQFATIDSA